MEILPILDHKLIFCEPRGARSQDPDKFLKDAKVFEEALLKDPNNSRNIFYCAQSYRDAGNLEKSLEWYLKRIKIGGWIEETYVSYLMAGKIIEIIQPNDVNLVETFYLKAFNFYPSRIESLVLLAAYCRKANAFDKAYFYAKQSVGTQQPKEGLFVEVDCYQWKAKDELAIAAYYIGKIQEATIINKSLLESKLLPSSEIDRVSNNLKFCLDVIL